MAKITHIIIHCSDSTWGSAREIRKWHLENGWKDIGYHFVITNGNILPKFRMEIMDGSVELGRPLDGDPFIKDNEVGAHALGYNENAIGICGIATKEWTRYQKMMLISLVRELMHRFDVPVENVLGHCETEQGKAQGKTCPNLDMNKLREELRNGD